MFAVSLTPIGTITLCLYFIPLPLLVVTVLSVSCLADSALLPLLSADSAVMVEAGMSNWQHNLNWMDDDEEQDSDTDSKLSGSAAADSVM